MIFGYRNAYIMPERVWIPTINEQWDEAGVAFRDPAILKRLKDQVVGFGDFVQTRSKNR
jgi:hypothetical protein